MRPVKQGDVMAAIKGEQDHKYSITASAVQGSILQTEAVVGKDTQQYVLNLTFHLCMLTITDLPRLLSLSSLSLQLMVQQRLFVI